MKTHTFKKITGTLFLRNSAITNSQSTIMDVYLGNQFVAWITQNENGIFIESPKYKINWTKIHSYSKTDVQIETVKIYVRKGLEIFFKNELKRSKYENLIGFNPNCTLSDLNNELDEIDEINNENEENDSKKPALWKRRLGKVARIVSFLPIANIVSFFI